MNGDPPNIKGGRREFYLRKHWLLVSQQRESADLWGGAQGMKTPNLDLPGWGF